MGDSTAGDVEAWLEEQWSAQVDERVFWAPYGWATSNDWLGLRAVEQLAVRISTATGPDGNVCFASGAKQVVGRNAIIIGLINRDTLGWAIVLNEGDRPVGDVRRTGYPYDNYDSFGALSAADICWSWVAAGCLPAGLTLRERSR